MATTNEDLEFLRTLNPLIDTRQFRPNRGDSLLCANTLHMLELKNGKLLDISYKITLAMGISNDPNNPYFIRTNKEHYFTVPDFSGCTFFREIFNQTPD